jgi:tetratricopeptide (TPR) repeat protein
VGSAVDEFRALHRLSLLWLNMGDYARAQECCQQALQLAQTLNSPRYATLVLDFLGLTHHYLGDDLTALRYLDQTAHLCEASSDQRGLAYALHWKGQVLLARGELTNAADCYAQAADIRLIHHQPHLAVQSQAGLARVRQAQGQLDQAMALIAPIVDQLDDLHRNDVEDPCMLWLNCYLVLHASGDSRASAVLDQAHAIVQERAARISDGAMRQTFLQNVVYNRQIIDAWQADPARKFKASEGRGAQRAPGGGVAQRRTFVVRGTPSLPLAPSPMALAPLAQLPAGA